MCKSIHLWQVPRWAACNQEVDAPAPLDSHIKITIVRDEAKTVPRNMLILTQVAQRLQEHGVAISDKTLARRLALLPKVLQLTVTDPMLLGRLKGLGAVKANAVRAKLASCFAISRALAGFSSLKGVAGVLQTLAATKPAVLAASPVVTMQQLTAAAAAEPRRPLHARRSANLAEAPPALLDPTCSTAASRDHPHRCGAG